MVVQNGLYRLVGSHMWSGIEVVAIEPWKGYSDLWVVQMLGDHPHGDSRVGASRIVTRTGDLGQPHIRIGD